MQCLEKFVLYRTIKYMPLLLLVVFCVSIGPTHAGAKEDALASLVATVQDITSIRSRFVQETDILMFKQPMESRGVLLYVRPNALLWEYQEPFVEGFSLYNGQVSRWEGSRGAMASQTRQDPVSTIIANNLVAWIALDLETIRKEYVVEVIGIDPISLRLTPKSRGLKDILADLVITFQPDGVAQTVIIRETRGGKTTITFMDTVTNKTIDPAEFPLQR